MIGTILRDIVFAITFTINVNYPFSYFNFHWKNYYTHVFFTLIKKLQWSSEFFICPYFHNIFINCSALVLHKCCSLAVFPYFSVHSSCQLLPIGSCHWGNWKLTNSASNNFALISSMAYISVVHMWRQTYLSNLGSLICRLKKLKLLHFKCHEKWNSRKLGVSQARHSRGHWSAC